MHNTCDTCGTDFPNNHDLYHHVRKDHVNLCHVCHENFVSSSQLQEHMDEAHAKAPVKSRQQMIDDERARNVRKGRDTKRRERRKRKRRRRRTMTMMMMRMTTPCTTHPRTKVMRTMSGSRPNASSREQTKKGTTRLSMGSGNAVHM